MRQMSTLWSNSASVFKSNAVTKASQSLGQGLATVAAILTERAQAPLQLQASSSISCSDNASSARKASIVTSTGG